MKQNDKEQLLSQIKEIEEIFNQQVNQLKQLINRYEQLDYDQQHKLRKTTIRLQKMIQTTTKNKIEQKDQDIINIKEGTYEFTEEDIENMKKSIKQTSLSQKLISKFNEEISKEIGTKLEINVNQKTTRFMAFTYCYYYGYLLNGVPTGRGVSVKRFQFYNGYFSHNVFQIGTLVKDNGYDIVVRKYTVEEDLEANYSVGFQRNLDGKDEGSPIQWIMKHWKKIIHTMIYEFPEMQQLIIETKDFTNQLTQLDEINKQLQIHQINQETIEYYSDMYYCGYIQRKNYSNQKMIREGFGVYYSVINRCQAIGIWSKDKLIYGTFLQLEQNYKIQGQIPDNVQHYLQDKEENDSNGMITMLFKLVKSGYSPHFN